MNYKNRRIKDTMTGYVFYAGYLIILLAISFGLFNMFNSVKIYPQTSKYTHLFKTKTIQVKEINNTLYIPVTVACKSIGIKYEGIYLDKENKSMVIMNIYAGKYPKVKQGILMKDNEETILVKNKHGEKTIKLKNPVYYDEKTNDFYVPVELFKEGLGIKSTEKSDIIKLSRTLF